MQSAAGCHAPAVPQLACARWRTYTPPCAPSSSGSGSGLGSRLVARAGKDDKSKKSDDKADFSARWALRVKNFFSSRRNYLQQAEQVDKQAAEKAYQAELAREEEKLRKMKEQVMEEREAQLRAQGVIGDPREGFIGSDIAKARLDLETSPLVRASLAVVRVRDLLKSLLLLPFTLVAAAFRAWQGLFESKRYENFLMSEGERIWYWRNRMENERWFWEVFVWDRLLFPVLAVVCYEYLVPNHFLWAVVVPVALWAWLADRLATPATPEFWLVAYFGFYRKVWPDLAAWLSGTVLPMLAW